MASDVLRSALFYQDVLGFSLKGAVDEKKQDVGALSESKVPLAFVIMKYEERVKIALESRHGFENILRVPRATPPGATVSFYFHVEDVDALYTSIKGKVEQLVPMNETWYGMREFVIRDPDGYILSFATPVKK